MHPLFRTGALGLSACREIYGILGALDKSRSHLIHNQTTNLIPNLGNQNQATRVGVWMTCMCCADNQPQLFFTHIPHQVSSQILDAGGVVPHLGDPTLHPPIDQFVTGTPSSHAWRCMDSEGFLDARSLSTSSFRITQPQTPCLSPAQASGFVSKTSQPPCT